MHISPINFLSFQNKKNYQTSKFNNNYMLPYDNVSFSGKKNVQEQPEHVQKSISLGKKIIKFARVNQLSYPTLEKILNENSPVPIHVDDIKNDTHLAAFSGKPVAHMLPLYNYDFKLTAANIYLGTIPQTSKEETDFIANVAHEYSHVLQRAADEDYYGITKYAKKPEEITAIARASQSILNELTQMCQQKLFTCEKDVKNTINSILTNRFDINKSLNGLDFDELITDAAFILYLQLHKDPNDMKNAIKDWIAKEAQNEKEAYTVTLSVLESSKHDPIIKAKRILNKELYSYINEAVKK